MTAHAKQKTAQKSRYERWYQLLVDEEDSRVCKDIPESQCTSVPQNFFIILITQLLTKIADSLANAKTVLPWVMNASGAPIGLTALLVPIRESGSMIPQLLIGGVVRRFEIRKSFFVIGCLAQAIFVFGIVLSGMYLNGLVAGLSILACLSLFSFSRGLCSVASKDVIGKTVPKTRRGRLTGISASLSGLLTIAIAALMTIGYFEGAESFVLFLVIAGLLWLIAAVIFSRISEQKGATEGSKNGISEAVKKLSLLRTDTQFRNFVIMRALLMSSGLAAPFLVTIVMSTMSFSASSQISLFVGLSGIASLVSGFVWGKMSDNDSLKVMIISGAGCALICFLAILTVWFAPPYLDKIALILFFLLMIVHEGVRLGRKTYVLDMASGNKRTDYVAVSNTVIGLLLLVVGGITGLLAQNSNLAVFSFFFLCCSAATILGLMEKSKKRADDVTLY